MYERHVPAHSSAAAVVTDDGGLEPVLVHLRTGNSDNLDAAALIASAEKLKELHVQGERLDLALRHEPRAGVYISNAVIDGSWIPVCATDIGRQDMARPTDEEMDQWWKTFEPFPTLGPKRTD